MTKICSEGAKATCAQGLGPPSPPPPHWPGSICRPCVCTDAVWTACEGGWSGPSQEKFTEGPGTNELLMTDWKGSMKSQHVKYEKGIKERKAIWKEVERPHEGRDTERRSPHQTRALAPAGPFPPTTHAASKKKIVGLNSFYASNTRNRPTFSHPMLRVRLIFGHLRSIGDHFWGTGPFQVGGRPPWWPALPGQVQARRAHSPTAEGTKAWLPSQPSSVTLSGGGGEDCVCK